VESALLLHPKRRGHDYAGQVYRPESLVRLEGYQALLRWRTNNHISGLHTVPYDIETEAGATKASLPWDGGSLAAARVPHGRT